MRRVLDRIWDESEERSPSGYRRMLTDEMFYFNNIAHMAKHIAVGGCGIRPFLDLWIFNRRVDFQPKKRKQLLQEGNLLAFAAAAENCLRYGFPAGRRMR